MTLNQATKMLCVLGMISLSSLAQAQTQRINYQGTISQIFDNGHAFDSSIQIGTPFSGTTTIDFSKSPEPGSNSTNAFYHFGSGFGTDATVGDYTLTKTVDFTVNNGMYIYVTNASPGGQDEVQTSSDVAVTSTNVSAATLNRVAAHIFLVDNSGTAITNTQLNVGLYDLSKWQTHFVQVQAQNSSVSSSGAQFNVAITSLSVATPEPGSLALIIGMGVTGAGQLLRKRRRNTRKKA